MRGIKTLSTHIATAIAAVIIGGAVLPAAASAPIDSPEGEPSPIISAQASGGAYGPDFSSTACATAPAAHKYELFQSPNYAGQYYSGSNDRMLASMVSTAPQNTVSPTYTYNLEVATIGRLWVTEVWFCTAMVAMVYVGTDTYGYPVYDYQISDAHWDKVKVTRDQHNRSLYIASPPPSTYVYDEVLGTSSSTYPVNYYVVSKGSGKTVPSTVTPYGPPPQK